MKIEIVQKLRPYSHVPGALCVIPGTHFVLQAFPALLKIGQFEIPLKVTGPVDHFTLQQDLERNCLYVFGKAQEGHFKVEIRASQEGFEISGDAQESIKAKIDFFLPERFERLSLGKHKALDWELVLRRFDLEEILPVVFALSQKIPQLPPQPIEGTAKLLYFPEDEIIKGFKSLCKAAFKSILVPRLNDDQHQGICPFNEKTTAHPFILLQEVKELIRRLFFRQEKNSIQLLPSCPFPAGRMIDIEVKDIGLLNLEWAKKRPRRAILRALSSGELIFDLQKEIKAFRVKTALKEKGVKHSPSKPIFIEEGKTYYFDRFDI